MDIYKMLPRFLSFLGHPAFSGIAILAGFAILVLQARNAEPVPRSQLVHPITKQPIRSKRRIWPTIKRPVWVCVVASLLAILIWIPYRTPLRRFVFVEELPFRSAQSPKPPNTDEATSSLGSSARSTNPPKSNPVPPAQPKMSATALPPPPIVIPLPDRPFAPKSVGGKSTVKYVATIDSQIVQASDKAPGTLYVSLVVANNSKYLGNISATDVENVAEALRKTGKVSVFINKSGGYGIKGNDLPYSTSLTPVHPRTIYFFDSTLDGTCAALKTIISGIVGQMNCKFMSIAASSDPNEPKIDHDFLVQSGLDMEIVL